MRPLAAIIGLGVAFAALASPVAHATAFDNADAADDAAPPAGAIERHPVWTFRCVANRWPGRVRTLLQRPRIWAGKHSARSDFNLIQTNHKTRHLYNDGLR
jgi:hypothetical protein